MYQSQLNQNGFNEITTEVKEAGTYYYAEHYHQQYLAKNPDGYCALVGTGVKIS
jgi:peptide-methionine (S)-S-oxide reductase